MRRVYELHKKNILNTIKNALNILKPIVDSKPKYYENTIIKKEQSTITYRGNHLLIDCRNVKESVCVNDKEFLEAMAWAASTAGMEVISQVRYRFGFTSEIGFTSFCLLDSSHISAHCRLDDSSHISAHSYGKCGKISLDIFTCGPTDPEKVFELLKSKIDLGDDIIIKRVKRFL